MRKFPFACGVHVCEAKKSSTWRELKALHFALTSFKDYVQGKSVKWHSDNQGAVRIVDIGSPNAELHSIALIFSFLSKFQCSICSSMDSQRA